MIKDKRIFTLSNLLSLSRLVLLIPIIYLLTRGTRSGDWWGLTLMVVAALTDVADGYTARKLNQKTDAGRILDPVADKICILMVIGILVTTRDFPLWFVFLLLFRELCFMSMGLDVISKRDIVLESKTSGKLTTLSLAFTVLFYTIRLHPLNRIFIGISLFFIILSGIDYGLRYRKMIKE